MRTPCQRAIVGAARFVRNVYGAEEIDWNLYPLRLRLAVAHPF